MIYLDFRKIPRPERSGYIAILAAYVLLCAIFEFSFVGDQSLMSMPNILCMLFPFVPEFCPVSKLEIENEQHRDHQITYVRFDDHSPIVSKDCTCHGDIQWFDERRYEHVRFSTEPTCGSVKEDWIKPTYNYPIYILDTGKKYIIVPFGEGRVRWHCVGGAKNALTHRE